LLANTVYSGAGIQLQDYAATPRIDDRTLSPVALRSKVQITLRLATIGVVTSR